MASGRPDSATMPVEKQGQMKKFASSNKGTFEIIPVLEMGVNVQDVRKPAIRVAWSMILVP